MSPTREPSLPPPETTASPQLRVEVLVASVRQQRVAPAVADWALGHLRQVDDIDVDVIELAAIGLPADEQLRPGGSGTTAVSARLEAADAYLVITPEYNHSYPASLKRLIDWHYQEWMFKPATVISYGARGGVLATEHLRGVFAELHVVTTRRGVALSAPWNHLEEGVFTPEAGAGGELDRAVQELRWWAHALRDARYQRPLPR